MILKLIYWQGDRVNLQVLLQKLQNLSQSNPFINSMYVAVCCVVNSIALFLVAFNKSRKTLCIEVEELAEQKPAQTCRYEFGSYYQLIKAHHTHADTDVYVGSCG